MAIADISNGDLMSSVRTKINQIIAFINGMFSNTNDNVAVGENNQRIADNANRITSVGKDSMFYKEIGPYETAMGYQSCFSDRTAARNTAVGYKTLHVNTTAFDNTAHGYKALEFVRPKSGAITLFEDIGGGSVRVTSAAHDLSNGDTVSIYGTGAWVDHSYTNNYDGSYEVANVALNTFEITATFVAMASLVTNGWWGIDTEGRNNTAIGWNSGGNIVRGSYNVCVGNSTDVPDADADYQLNIANLITGNIKVGEQFVKVGGALVLEPQAADPTSPVEGMTYFNTTDKHFYGYNGTTFVQLDN